MLGCSGFVRNCEGAVLSNERHLIFECQALGQLRARHAHLFYAQMMLAFMWHEDVSVALSFRLCLFDTDAAAAAASSDDSSNQP